MKLYGWFGLILLAVSGYGLLHGIEPFKTWFYCFAWWSYILLADSLLLRIRGRSLLCGRGRELGVLLPASVFVWLIFEAFNFRLENWAYSIPAMETWRRWTAYVISYATVLPAVFITADLVERFGRPAAGPSASERALPPPEGAPRPSRLWPALGLAMTLAPLAWPRYFFPALWLGPIFLLNPFMAKLGVRPLSFDARSGDRRRVMSLMLGGFLCGVFWEFWNYWAGSKWVYSVPFVGEWKIFEMPVLGFLGFLPFALECWILYHLFDAALGSMHSAIAKTALWLAVAAICFAILLGIDAYTVIDMGANTRFAY